MRHQLIQSGTVVGNLSLASTTQAVCLGDYRGRQNVLLYWMNHFGSSRGWRGAMRLGQLYPTFKATHTAVFIIGNGRYLARATQFAADMGLHFPILSDPDGRVARQFGVCGEDNRDWETAVLLDKQGVVRYSRTAYVPYIPLDETTLVPILKTLNLPSNIHRTHIHPFMATAWAT